MKNIFTIILLIAVLISLPIKVNSEKTNPLCGPQSLLMICEHYGIDTTLEEICTLSGYNKQLGTTMLGLYHAAQKKGLSVLPVRFDIGELHKIKEYSIVYVDGNHFLVYCGSDGKTILLRNPPDSQYNQSQDVFSKRWDGEILLFGNNAEEFTRKLSQTKTQPNNGPEIQFNHTSHYFGLVEEGEELTHTFEFTNIGTDILHITARSSCNCTALLLSENKISPGNSGKIRIDFDTKGKKGQALQTVDVRSNDHDEKRIKLTIAATVRSDIKIIPERIHAGDLKFNQKIKRKIHVIDQGDGTLKVDTVLVPENIVAKILPFEEKNELRYIPIILTIKGGNEAGPFNKNIAIKTNKNKSRVINVNITGNTVGLVNVYPPRLYFGSLERNSKSERETTLIPTKKRNFTISKIAYASECISVKTELDKVNSKYRLITTILTPDDITTVRDTLAVFFDGDKFPGITIPLYAKVK